jgi:ketosteroid isomerase-like protein
MMIAKLNVLRRWPSLAVLLCVTAAAVTTIAAVKHASAEDDSVAVRSLDAAYQAAVKTNDVATMERLLADDFVLVTGRGQTFTKTDLLNEARGESIRYEKQDDSDQTVRLWGDTAVITAKLWMKGMEEGRPFDKRVWFSDTYVRTPAGWKYVFGQSSLPLPN